MTEPNTLIIGDIHSNFHSNIFRIKKAIEDYDPSHIVFLGDYVDTRYQDGHNYDRDDINDVLVDLQYLTDWVTRQRLCHRAINCLVGNHDWAYISKRMPTTQTIDEIADIVKEQFDKLQLRLVVPVCYENDHNITKHYLCSHAGLNTKWLKQFFPTDYSANTINRAFQKLYDTPSIEPNILELISRYRGWTDPIASPIWCDLKELFLDTPKLVKYDCGQIIGHTNVGEPINIFNATGRPDELWAVDTSTTGKCGLLMLEVGKPAPFAIDYTDEEIDAWIEED